MKLITLVMLFVFAMSLMVFAYDQTERGNYTTPIDPLTVWLNSNDKFLHVHEYKQYEPKIELGIMAEITLYETALLGIPTALGVESQYDFNNDNWGFYGKVSMNLSPMIKGFLGTE